MPSGEQCRRTVAFQPISNAFRVPSCGYDKRKAKTVNANGLRPETGPFFDIQPLGTVRHDQEAVFLLLAICNNEGKDLAPGIPHGHRYFSGMRGSPLSGATPMGEVCPALYGLSPRDILLLCGRGTVLMQAGSPYPCRRYDMLDLRAVGRIGFECHHGDSLSGMLNAYEHALAQFFLKVERRLSCRGKKRQLQV